MRHLIGVLLLLSFFVSCSFVNKKGSAQGQTRFKQNGKLKVLSTIAMIDDLVREIGGEHVDNITLIRGDLDPHSYQLVKGDDEKLAAADLILFNGLGLEHGPSLQHFLYDSKKAVAVGDYIRDQSPELILMHKGQVDPHIWMDIAIWEKSVHLIVKTLSALKPELNDYFEENGRRLTTEMLDLHLELKAELNKVPPEKRYLVTSHDAFNYFTRAYLAEESEITDGTWTKRFAAPEGLAPESQLSTTDIQYIIDHLQRYRVKVLFPESNVSQDSIRKILQAGKEKGLDLTIAKEYLYSDAMGLPGTSGDTYLKMVEYNARTIQKYLQGSEP